MDTWFCHPCCHEWFDKAIVCLLIIACSGWVTVQIQGVRCTSPHHSVKSRPLLFIVKFLFQWSVFCFWEVVRHRFGVLHFLAMSSFNSVLRPPTDVHVIDNWKYLIFIHFLMDSMFLCIPSISFYVCMLFGSGEVLISICVWWYMKFPSQLCYRWYKTHGLVYQSMWQTYSLTASRVWVLGEKNDWIWVQSFVIKDNNIAWVIAHWGYFWFSSISQSVNINYF
jgi:hypothetical protein